MSPSVRDARLAQLLIVVGAVVAAILALIVGFLFREAWPLIARYGFAPFFLDHAWHPTEGLFGLSPMLSASILLACGAVLFATPLGIASALFCRFYAPPAIGRIYRWMVMLLAGIPSVVLGLWGLTVIVPLIGWWQPPGANLLAGALVLALMILPTVALTTEAALAAVPQSYLSGAAALGLSREATIVSVILPATRGSIIAGILLAAARALGETMAVLMVSGNVVQVPTSLFSSVRTLTANIALEMAYATGDHRSALFVSGLLLTGLVLVLATAASRFNKVGQRV